MVKDIYCGKGHEERKGRAPMTHRETDTGREKKQRRPGESGQRVAAVAAAGNDVRGC